MNSKRSYSKHGLSSLKTSMKKLGSRSVDGRTAVARSLEEWRSELIRDLGGEDSVSTQQVAVVELAVRTKLLLDSIDAWLLRQPTLVNARRKSLLPAVRERQQLADSFARYMQQLGLERREKPTQSLHDYIETRRNG